MMTDLENDSTQKIGLAEKNCLEKFWEFFFENIAKKFPFVILFIKTEESKNNFSMITLIFVFPFLVVFKKPTIGFEKLFSSSFGFTAEESSHWIFYNHKPIANPEPVNLICQEAIWYGNEFIYGIFIIWRCDNKMYVWCSCGSCGYELKLCSSNRNTKNIGSKYGKNIKRGVISFLQVDESRFTLVDEFKCIPYFISRHSWGLFCHRTKLLCRKCSNHVGNAYVRTSPYPLVLDESDSAPAPATATTDISTCRKYDIRLRALQPSSSEPSAIPLLTWSADSNQEYSYEGLYSNWVLCFWSWFFALLYY